MYFYFWITSFQNSLGTAQGAVFSFDLADVSSNNFQLEIPNFEIFRFEIFRQLFIFF